MACIETTIKYILLTKFVNPRICPKFSTLTIPWLITLQKALKYDSAQNASDARREISEE
jgi:hypothetical protein